MTRNKGRAWLAPLSLFVYLIVLVLITLRNGDAGSAAEITVWDLQDSRRLLSWVAALAVSGLWDVVRFVPVGFLTMLALVGLPKIPARSVVTTVLAATLGIPLALLVRGFEIGQPWQTPGSFDIVLPLIGSFFGVWIGATWLRGRRARLWLVPKLAVLLLAIAGAAAAFLFLATENSPAGFEGARVTSAEKRRLVRMIREKNSLNLSPGEIQELRLTEHDLDVLLAWGLSIGSDQRKAKVLLEPGAVTLRVSAGFPTVRGGVQYLNVVLGGKIGVERGHLSLRFTQLRLGRIEAPRWAVDLLSPVVATFIRHDRRVRPFLKSIETLRIEPAGVRLTYGRLDLPKDYLADFMAAPGTSEEVGAAIRAQIRNLQAQAKNMPRGERRFGAALETAFSLARSRSKDGDPIIENRAAIFALGIVLGHPKLARFLGPVVESRAINQTRRALGRVTIRGRRDWMQHFLVSAALALFSTEAVSDAAGLLKEELDAGKGGSGFSFADLLADRAGTTFALAATRNEAAARAMQDRLARGFRMDDFFPPAADLPEGIPDSELQARYGGVGGKEYQRIVAEIERRIARCEAYR
jgi:glycopeptide antibiotics resistance protein